ncbi:hypothetical protein V8C86DRAFT_2484631 [Haematococcus lacustris]
MQLYLASLVPSRGFEVCLAAALQHCSSTVTGAVEQGLGQLSHPLPLAGRACSFSFSSCGGPGAGRGLHCVPWWSWSHQGDWRCCSSPLRHLLLAHFSVQQHWSRGCGAGWAAQHQHLHKATSRPCVGSRSKPGSRPHGCMDSVSQPEALIASHISHKLLSPDSRWVPLSGGALASGMTLVEAAPAGW